MPTSLKTKSFLILTLCIVLTLCATYFYAFMYQIGSHVKAEWWVKNVYIYKEHIASSKQSRKVIIASGSNSLFGIDSSVVESKVGLEVANLSVQAGLGLDFIYHKIKDYISEGDIVVLPLEYVYYSGKRYTNSGKGYTKWQVNNYMAWGWDDYLSHLSWFDLLNFMVSVPKQRILEGVKNQVGSNPVLDRDVVIKQVNEVQTDKSEQWRGYSHLSLNRHGDILVDSLPTNELLEEYVLGFEYGLSRKPSDKFYEIYEKINEIVNARKAHLIVTWPVSIRNSKYDLSHYKYQQLTTEFKNEIEKHGVKIRCNPALFHMDIDFFFNTKSHTNKVGAHIRSINLGTCLNEIINNPDYEDMEYSIANQIVLEQQRDAQNSFQANFYKRLRDLKQIRDALELYYGDNNSFPVSRGFDGLYTKWGESGEDWILGLSPAYIRQLPRDPRNSDSPSKQYLYKSNGKAYKLISHGPEDCKYASLRYPELVDPKRDCWAYGYWSESADQW